MTRQVATLTRRRGQWILHAAAEIPRREFERAAAVLRGGKPPTWQRIRAALFRLWCLPWRRMPIR